MKTLPSLRYSAIVVSCLLVFGLVVAQHQWQILSFSATPDEPTAASLTPTLSPQQIASADLATAAINDGGSVAVRSVTLSGIVGYPELNELQLCSGADTLAFLVYTTSDVPLTDVGVVLRFGGGIEYGGFVDSPTPGSVVLASAGNPLAPRLTIPSLTQDEPVIIYLGVTTNCSSLSGNYTLRAEYNYDYTNPNTSLTSRCNDQDNFSPELFRAAVLTPILNISNNPAPINFTSLNQTRCQTLIVSQDGINATLDSFQLQIDSLDLSLLTVESINVNGSVLPTYEYDAPNLTLRATIDNSFFPANGNPSPADNFFNEDETVTIEVCYSVAACIDEVLPNIVYRVDQICQGTTCTGVGDQVDAVMDFNPNFGISPVATVTLLQGAEVCGPDARLAITFRSSNNDPVLGLYENIQLELFTCDSNFLILTEVILNGTALPAAAVSYTSGTVKRIDFTGLTTDPDGPGGLTDTDGDGFFDDLPGDQQIDMEVRYAVQCPDAVQGCVASSCQISSVRIIGERYCGQSFSQSDAVPSAPVIGYDSSSAFAFDDPVTDTLPNNRSGYNFGQIGYIGGMNNTPSSVDMEFTYNFNPTNFVSCGGSHVFQFAVSAESQIAFDMEFTDIEIDTDGTGVFTPIAPGDITVVDSTALSTRYLEVQVPNPSPNTDVTMRWTSTLDTSYCRPGVYFGGAASIIEECPAGCDCRLPKACGEVTMYVNPEDTSCVCDIQSIVEIERLSLGYTDPTRSSLVDPASIPANDMSRFLPGDTMKVRAIYTILNDDPFNLANAYLDFNIRQEPVGANVNNMDRVRSLLNGQLARVMNVSIERPGTSESWDVSTVICEDAMDGNDINYGVRTWGPSRSDMPIIDSGLPQTVEGYGYVSANSGDDRRDGNIIYLRIQNNNNSGEGGFAADDCLTPLRDMIGGFQVDDIITIEWQVPVILNPGFDPSAGPELAPQIFAIGSAVNRLNPSTPRTTISNGTCWTNEIYDFWEPEIEANSEIIYSSCGATIEHTFEITNTPPADWFTTEYRPIIGIENLATTIPPPYVYAGGAQYIDINGTMVDIEPDSSRNNMGVFEVGGTTYYSPGQSNSQLYFIDAEEANGSAGGYRLIDGADPTLSVDQGDNDFTRVGGTFPLLGVGQNIDDSLVFRIPVIRLCPEGVDATGLNLTYYASYLTLPEYNNPSGPFLCNNNNNSSAAYYWNDGVACTGRYWNFSSRDTANVHRFAEQEGIDYLQTGTVSSLPSLSVSTDNLLLGDDPAGNETNRLTVQAGAGSIDLTDVVVSISVPSTVELIDVIDVASSNSLTFTEAAVTTDSTIYSVLVAPTLSPGSSIEIDIVTELLLCPSQLVDPNSVPAPQVCINATAGGCAAPEVVAAISGGAGGCTNASTCYTYTGDASDIQVEWFVSPASITLCDELVYAARIKNVRGGILFEPSMEFLLPPGLSPISGTWEYAYPGDLDFNDLAWTSVGSDPNNPFGTYYIYPDIGDFIAPINASGLPGVGAPNGENEVAFRFRAVTNCDDFVSGRRAWTRSIAYDGCGNDVRALDFTDAIIADGANPVDFPRFLVIADPVDLNCGVSGDTLSFTSLALQGMGSTSNTTMCISLPMELTYTGTLDFVSPAGYTPSSITSTVVGTNTEICFDVPDNISVGQFYAFNMIVDVSDTASCGELEVGTDINSVVTDVVCSTGPNCDINVNNSLNTEVFLNVTPPLEAVELQASLACDADPDNVTYDYVVEVTNAGPAVNSTATIALYRDLDQNGALDDFDPLLDSEMQALMIATGDTLALSGTLSAANAVSCPAFLVIDYGSGCGCDREIIPINSPEPTFIAELPNSVYLCPGDDLVLEVCEDFELALSPSAGGTIMMAGNTATISINAGFGEDEPVLLQVTGGVGECPVAASRAIYQLPNLELGPYAATPVCMDGVTQLDMELPTEWADGAVISWMPETYLSDPTSPTPEIENPAADITYTITATFNDGQCGTSADFPVDVIAFDADIAVMETAVCQTASLNLADLMPTILPAGFTGMWETTGDGTFDDGDPDGDAATGDFPTATMYTPGTADIQNRSFVLSLRTDDPSILVGPSACAVDVDEVTITVLIVDCGSFPWDGQ